nr:retrovirus-related Pol polyprotein from transposon TNT 1-94 [Tanacetum cinerariifolium]
MDKVDLLQEQHCQKTKPDSYGSCSYNAYLCKSSFVPTLNQSLIHTLHEKIYYELLKGKKLDLKYFYVFGSLCYPTNDYDDVGKLKVKVDIGIFVGYAPTKKEYRVYNKRMRKIQETIHVTFNELSGGLEHNALQSGRTSSDLVKDPPTPNVSTTVQ